MGLKRGGRANVSAPANKVLGKPIKGIVSAAPTAIVVTEAQMTLERPI